MARKFTPSKTQLRLLAQLDASRFGRLLLERAWGHGPQGGRVSYGDRDVNAALGLVEAGLLVRDGYEKSMFPEGGYTMHVSLLAFRRPAAKEAA